MRISFDAFLVTGFACVIGAISLTSLGRTNIGTPYVGWSEGSYQRAYEARFESSVPTQSTSAEIWTALRWWAFREPAQGAISGGQDWLFTTEEFQVPTLARRFEDELLKAADAAREFDFELVVAVVPDKARMQSQRLNRGRSEKFQTRYDAAMQSIGDVGLQAVDLRPALVDSNSFMRTDTHWSPIGARGVAEKLASVVRDHDYERSEFVTSSTGLTQFKGDLIAFVDTGSFRDWIGPKSESIETFETNQLQEPADLFGENLAPVVLVGTSYSARAEFHFDGFLKSALSADVLNLSEVGRGPFAPMDRLFDDIRASTLSPAIVIWEIPERYLKIRSQ